MLTKKYATITLYFEVWNEYHSARKRTRTHLFDLKEGRTSDEAVTASLMLCPYSFQLQGRGYIRGGGGGGGVGTM